MAIFSFDDLDGGIEFQANSKPIWTVDQNNDKELLKWLNAEVQWLEQENRDRIHEIKKHIALYKGISFDQIGRDFHRDQAIDRSRIQKKLVVNHLYDLTEQRASRLTKFKPAVTILPTNDEFEDKQSAKVAELFWNHIKYVQQLDKKTVDIVKNSLIAGEGYLFIEWDPECGEEHPISERLREGTEEDTVQIPMKDGTTKTIQGPVKVGDVTYEVFHAFQMLFQKKTSYEKADYCFRVESKDIDEVKIDYPEKADDIKEDKDHTIFDMTKLQDVKAPNATVVYTFYHKHHKAFPKGRLIKFTQTAILENRDLPYSHGDFPFERLPDIEIPAEQHARSFYINTRHLAAQVNNLTTVMVRNQKLTGHPKWMVPRGSVKLDQLNNDISIVQFTGPTPPILAQANPTGTELFKIRQDLKEDLQQISGVFGVSRGEPPPGIKAGVALQFLNEQENERQNSNIANYNEFVKRVAIKTVKTAADFYRESDKRTMRVLGKDNQWRVKFLDPRHLAKAFDIRIQNSSALPESKAARTQTIIDLKDAFPELLPNETVADLLDLGQTNKFFDEVTASVRTAQWENEELSQGRKHEPKEWEYHIQHWLVHVSELQSTQF